MRKTITILLLFVCIYANAATYYVRSGGGNWGTASTWSLTDGGGATGSVPLVTDNAYITVNSGNCTMNVSGVCKYLNITGYTGTLTMTNGVTVSGSMVINSPSATITGTGAFTINAAGGVTTNGKTITQPLIFTGAIIDSLDCNAGFINNLTMNTAGATLVLKSGVTIQGKMTSTASTAASPIAVKSSIVSTSRSIIFFNTASMDLDFVNFTDVDASNGLTIYSYLGTLTRTVNIDNTMNNTIIHASSQILGQ